MSRRPAVQEKPFDALHTLLATARDLAKGLTDDPQLERVVRAFRLFPEADREAILQVLEKDAAWRSIVWVEQVSEPLTRPTVPHRRGARVKVPRFTDGAVRAPLSRLASTSNTSIGGIQLASAVHDPIRTAPRGRGKNGARLVDSGLSIDGRRCASFRDGTCETSRLTESRDSSGATPAGEKAIADE